MGSIRATTAFLPLAALVAGILSCTSDKGTGESSEPPVIVSQPVASALVTAGTMVKMGVKASGASLSYRWIRNGTDTVGTADTLTLAVVTPADSGSYVCVVRNGAGAATSSAFILRVNIPPPVILSQPPEQLQAFVGETVKIGIKAFGYGNLTYQWVKDGEDTLQQAGDTLVLQDIQLDATATYHCVVRNEAGTTESETAWLKVSIPPPVFPRATLLDSGAVLFESNCTGCHGQFGEGGRGTQLANADFVLKNRTRTIEILLRGNQDTLTVNGECVTGGGMPAWGESLGDVEIASMLTYIRAVLNDSTVVSCSGPGACVKVARSAAEIAKDSVSVAEVRAVRDTLTPYPDGYLGAECPVP